MIARVEQGSEDPSLRAAVRQFDEDARLQSESSSFNRAQLYFLTLRMMSDNADYQQYPALWARIAQLLKDAAHQSLEPANA